MISGEKAVDVFISYRRSDQPVIAAMLYDKLRQKLGADRVFMDLTSLVPGAPFPAAVDRALQSASMVVAIIGSRWSGRSGASGARISRDDDFVRREIRVALERNVSVVPVIVGAADLKLHLRNLPDDLEGLLARQALTMRPENSLSDVNEVVDRLTALLQSASADEDPHPRTSPEGAGPPATQTTTIYDGVKGKNITIGFHNDHRR